MSALPHVSPMMIAMIDTLGKYRILHSLGRGSCGEVYKALHPELNIHRAIKVPFQQDFALGRQVREAVLQARLNHPGIVQIIDAERDGSIFFIVMEYVEGESLRNMLARDGRLSPDRFKGLAVQMCEALVYAHGQRVVHQDLKPENLLVNSGGRVKMADFGLARMLEGGRVLPSRISGTPNYMAPEQIDGAVTVQTDLWSLGAVFYEMLTGSLAFDGKNQWDVIKRIKNEKAPDINGTLMYPGLGTIIGRLLEKDPAGRYPSAPELLGDLKRCFDDRKESETHKTIIGVSWPCFRGDAARSGSLHAAPGQELHEQWAYRAGSAVLSSPAWSGGRIVFGTNNGEIHCLDASLGNRIWRFTTGDSVYASPAIAGGTVFAGSYDGVLYAIDGESGALQWTFTCPGPVSSSPAVRGSDVVFGCYDGNLYCLDARSGVKRWCFSSRAVIESSPLVVAGTVYCGSQDGHLYALDVQSGNLLWKTAAGNMIDSSATYAGGLVYVGSYDGRLYCFGAEAGDRKWAYACSDWITSTAAVRKDMVYTVTRNGRLHALDAVRGSILWTWDAGSRVSASPCITDACVIVGTESGLLVLLDAIQGSEISRIETAGAVLSSPAAVESNLYAGCSSGTFYCFR